MPFEIDLARRLDVWTLRIAGMATSAYQEKSMDVALRHAPLPFEVKLPYFLRDPPGSVSVTMLADGPVVRLGIAAEDESIERQIQVQMQRYAAENDGEARLDREHKAVWKEIGDIFAHHGMTSDEVASGKMLLHRAVIDELSALASRVERYRVSNISDLFANSHVAKADREYAVRWLIDLFTENPDPFERAQLSLRIEENAVLAVSERLVELIENRKFGGSRAGLLTGLARMKHPRAADVIASVLHEEHMAWSGLRALARLKATQHLETIRRCLRHPEAGIRREAKNALKKLGHPVETPPPPVHLVKAKSKIPAGLEEWSVGLDMDGLVPTLEKLATCIVRGFGATEVAEVVAVAEAMRVDQSKAFRFPIEAATQLSELWVIIFMDDVDSPDLHVHANSPVINQFAPLVISGLEDREDLEDVRARCDEPSIPLDAVKARLGL